MATQYPNLIDSFTNPSGTNTLDSPDHATQHTNTNGAAIAIQNVLGTTAGTSVLKNFTAGLFAASTAGTETFTNKTLTTPVLNGVPTGTSLDSIMPWNIDIDPLVTTFDASLGSWGLAVVTTSPKNAILQHSPGNQNDYIQYQVILAAGTWTITTGTRNILSSGIITVKIDGVSVGTIDTYNVSDGSEGQNGTITGITVATSGKHALKLLMATKNASSSGYALQIYALKLTRTA